MGVTQSLFSPKSNFTRKIAFIIFDILAFSSALVLAFIFRFKPFQILNVEPNLFIIISIFLVIKLSVFYFFKLYDISWRFVSLQDLANIGKACSISFGILFVLIYGLNLGIFRGFPRSIIWIDLILSFLFSSAFKISKRMYLEVMRQNIGNSELKRTLIVGAGIAGEQLLRDIHRTESRIFYPVCLVDDDPLKQNLYIQGIKVVGKIDNLPEIIKDYKIDTILISILSVDRKFHRRIFQYARSAGVNNVKVVSTINDISDSVKVGMKDIRNIDLSDLIGRQAVSINTRIISNYLKNKKVLITGAAGSIGSEISRQVLSYHPSEIGILDINESDLCDLELELKRLMPSAKIKMFLCDISNQDKVFKIFENYQPEVVLHAAAFKHVPIMEKFPEEAVRVNIIGTHILASAAKIYNVESFILISTDKAVNPTSIMGVSKRIAEYIVTGTGRSSTCSFVAVRFGNVIGSRGSALPIFMEQIRNGGPITVTHPDMKRYFMTIPEAVALVLQAGATGKNGDVFVLDMGEPIKIVDLARDLILLNNLIPDKDIKIEFTGIREGEKLFEEILTSEEGVINTSHEKIYKARLVCIHNETSIQQMVEEFSNINDYQTKKDWVALFKYYVPAFQPSLVIDPIEIDNAGLDSTSLSLTQNG